MCTSIIEIVRAEGMAKRGDEWFTLSQAVVAYDHARHAPLGDVITLDFLNTGLDPGARAGIELTLATAKEMGYDRVIAVHQPFTYSRTKMLMDDFAKVLRAADQVVLLPIMGGREKDDGSVRSEDLAAKLPGSVVVDGLEGAAAWVRQNAKKGDLVVCMSCGDLYKAADMMVEK